jgi:hypothetical protein
MVGVRLHFGKHKNKLLEDVPCDYLAWALENCNNISMWLKAAIARELERRIDARAEEAPPPSPSCGLVDIRGVISSWYREMSLRFHPDRGGSDEAMKAINHAYDRLKQLAGA